MSDSMIINQVNHICIDSGLQNVIVKILKDDDINAEAHSAVFGQKQLCLTAGALNLPWEEIAAIIGHEIIHLKNNDGTILDWIKRFTWFISSFVVLFVMLLSLLTLDKIPHIGVLILLILIPCILIYTLFLFFLCIIDCRRFWLQLQELRADRLACKLSGVSRLGMASLLRRLQREYPEASNDPWYEKYYYRYFLLVAHPCLSRRVSLIEKYRKWSAIDYVLHFFIMIKWFITGKGWNGG